MAEVYLQENANDELITKQLYLEEVVINVYLFMVAGYETL